MVLYYSSELGIPTVVVLDAAVGYVTRGPSGSLLLK